MRSSNDQTWKHREWLRTGLRGLRLGLRRGSPDAGQVVVNPPVPLPVVSADAAARALQERFLANADRGDDAANDELVDEMLRRMRALRASREDGC